MIPIRDTLRARTFPVVNWLIIVLNVLVFLYEISLGEAALHRFVNTYGMVPARLWHEPLAAWPTLFTSMFLHGGWFHLLSNMWMLYIFGDNVEDRMGSGRYLVFYLASGLVAGLVQAWMQPTSWVPTVGASGAIAGVLGAYVLFYPRGRVFTMVPLIIFITFIEVPAWIFLGVWFISQLYSGWMALLPGAAQTLGGVAWWAHIGGFVFGLLFARLFARRVHRVYSDEFYRW